MNGLGWAVGGGGSGDVSDMGVRRRLQGASPNPPSVLIAEDDAAIQTALAATLAAAGLCVTACGCVGDVLSGYADSEPTCLVLGRRAWGRDALGVCDMLVAERVNIPFIALVRRNDVRGAICAQRRGAAAVLALPCGDIELLESLEDALLQDERLRRRARDRAEVTCRLGRLSEREREILDLVVAGRGNKEIARGFGIVRRTMGFHLANILRKTETETVAELVCMVVSQQSPAGVDRV